MALDINETLNELLVKLFRSITAIEEQAVRRGEYKDVTANDLHVIEAIGPSGAKNMSSVARLLSVTTGTLTISVNSLVKKGYVSRERSEKDRRVVLVSLTGKGKKAFEQHKHFHEEMIGSVVSRLDGGEQEVLCRSLDSLLEYFQNLRDGKM